jgi:hypothetical protein
MAAGRQEEGFEPQWAEFGPQPQCFQSTDKRHTRA